MTDSFELVLSPTASLDTGKYPGLDPQILRFDGFTKHRDVPVPLRDGTIIYIDLFLPETPNDAPALIGWSPYGKHGLKSLAMMPGADVDPAWVSPHVIWEGPDPAYWCARGYAVVSPDPRGAWGSQGTLTFQSRSEAEDGCDVVGWIAQQDWNNGKVGMLGVSYLAISQWMIAARRPPALAAICPWEGLSDPYNEVYFHGGIPEHGFMQWWQPKSRFSLSPAEDILEMAQRHPMLDAYWQSKSIELERIEAPAYVVASWADHGMHTRGTLEGFRRIGSQQKWLEVHGQKKWRHFYHPESVARQTAFFDHFLRGENAGIEAWPKIRMEIRENNAVSSHRTARDWPDPEAKAERLYLNCATLTLTPEPPAAGEIAAYNSEDGSALKFDFVAPEDIEIVGGSGLHMWIAADNHNEADVFVALQKLDAEGQEVGLRYYSTFDDGPTALGWLRASHRQLTETATELAPKHSHAQREPLIPGDFVKIDVEIWPTGTLIRKGEALRLVICGRDIYRFDTGAPEMRHAADNRGVNRIASGPERRSYLTLPIRRLAKITK